MLCPRPEPCPSCPYRADAPPGLWHPDEYAKLPAYDGETAEQPAGLFHCHTHPDEHLCSGWVAVHQARGHHRELLALRLGVAFGTVHPDAPDYTTEVELLSSGAEAAEHGDAPPTERTRALMAKLQRLQSHRARKGSTDQ
jgi:hypothetical protein